jgi:hypothetical protein
MVIGMDLPTTTPILSRGDEPGTTVFLGETGDENHISVDVIELAESEE